MNPSWPEAAMIFISEFAPDDNFSLLFSRRFVRRDAAAIAEGADFAAVAGIAPAP